MNLRAVNFNLVPILRELLRERNVSRAAAALGLTRSGASAALQRLRDALQDPLLVQVGRGMELTPRARALIEPVEQLCAMMTALLNPPAFDPAQMTRSFRLSTADFVTLQIATRMIPDLSEHAPGVQLQFVDPGQDIIDRLVHGDLDLAILPTAMLGMADSAGVKSAPLFIDHFVAVVGSNHRLAQMDAPKDADFDAERRLIYHFNRSDDGNIQHAMSGQQPGAVVSAALAQMSLLPLLALATGAVAIVPSGFAHEMARWLPLKILKSPGDRVVLDIRLIWGPMIDSDPAHIWLRERLRSVMATRC